MSSTQPPAPSAPAPQGQPQTPGAQQGPASNGSAVAPFADFYAATGGDSERAEQMVPGITSGQGAKLLKMGPNGKPHVEFKTVEAQALFDKWYREHLAKPQGGGAPVGPSSQPGAGGGVPEFLPLDKNTKADEATYPGIESAPNGYLPYLQQDEKGHLARDAQGRPMIRNPAHPNTQKLIKETSNHLASSRKKWDELRAAQGKATAEDGN